MAMQLGKVFLGVTPADQRTYITSVLKHLRDRINRVVVPCAGQFTLVKCAIEAGFQPSEIVASDISFFSSAIGTVYAGRPLASLPFEVAETEVVGDTIERPRETLPTLGSDAERIAYLLWLLKLRQLRQGVYYEKIVYDALVAEKAKHLREMTTKIEVARRIYDGITYRVADVRAELRADWGADAIAIVNPPAYAAGSYAKMFPLEGLIDFRVPGLEEFDWKREYRAEYRASKAQPFPVIWYKKYRDLEGIDAEDVVFAKELKKGEFDFWLMTKPEMLDGYAHRSAIAYRAEKALKPYKHLPTWGFHDRLTPESTVRVVRVELEHALYYRDLWAHRLGNTKSEVYYLLIVDGKVFGSVGFHVSDLFRLRSNYAFEVFGFSAPSAVYPNINRLLMYLITCEDMAREIRRTSRVNRVYDLKGLKTTCLAKYRHVKLNSKLLKKTHIEKLKNGMYKIQYEAEFRRETYNEALRAYLAEFEEMRRTGARGAQGAADAETETITEGVA
jgi:hypothetical protein